MAKYDKVIPPGQEGKIQIVIEGKKVHGAFSKSATVESNDPDNPKMSITIAGNEIQYVNIAPSDRVYLQGRYGEAVTKELTISSNEEGLDFALTGLSSNIDDKITYTYEKGDVEGEWKVTVYKNPKLPTLSTYGSLFVYSNSEKSPEQTVQVQVVTKGAITVQPQLINYGRVKFPMPGETASSVTKAVSVVKSTGEFEIRDVTFNSDHFKAKIEELTPGRTYRVHVTFDPPEVTKARQREIGEMTIHTDDPLEPSITVRLVARAL